MSTSDNLGDQVDDIYAALIDAHEGLSEDQSAALDARLVLLLLNEVGDRSRIEELIAHAKTALSTD